MPNNREQLYAGSFMQALANPVRNTFRLAFNVDAIKESFYQRTLKGPVSTSSFAKELS